MPASTSGRAGTGHLAGSTTAKEVISSVLVSRRTLAVGAPDGTRYCATQPHNAAVAANVTTEIRREGTADDRSWRMAAGNLELRLCQPDDRWQWDSSN
ncbi:hypothetical protein Tamer19_50500 [Cupriavidus sp. TA19]|nr:hypothetical protein Tamer19_50500 [Cupriavidus sp. TA19]